MPQIVAPDGTALPFNRERLERSLLRRGMPRELAAGVGERVERLVSAHPEESIPIAQLNPLIGEALIESAAGIEAEDEHDEPDVPRAPARPRTARVAARPAWVPRDPAQQTRLDPWFAFRRSFGLPGVDGSAGVPRAESRPMGLAYPGLRVTKTVYANDTSVAKVVSLSVAYSGHLVLELPGGKRAELAGIGREVRDVEVGPGQQIQVMGAMEPYSVASWWIH